MKTDFVFAIVLGIVIGYIFILYRIDKVESMADVSVTDQVKEAVKQVYMADVEAIRNLSNVATQLQAGGLKVPGNLAVLDNLSVSNKTNEGGRLRVLNELKSGKPDQTNDWSIWNMTGDYGNKLSFWRYNGDGKNAGPALDLFDDGKVNVTGPLNAGNNINVANNVVLNTSIQNPNGQLRMSNQGIMFGGPNTDREVNSGQISAGLHIPNSLNIVGMSGDKGAGSRRVDVWAEGGLNVYGPVRPDGLGMRTWILNSWVKNGDRIITDPEGSVYNADRWILGIIGMNQDSNWDKMGGRIELYTYVNGDNNWCIRGELEGPDDRAGVRILAMPINYFDKAWGRGKEERVNW